MHVKYGIWSRLNLNDVEIFKSEIRKWEPIQSECTLCLSYIQSIGYMNISNN